MNSDSAEARSLLALIERIERLEEDKKQVAEDIKDVYAEAKGTGYDVKVLREVVKRRAEDKDKRREFEEVLELYLGALGMLADTPLGRAAVERDVPSTKRKATAEALEAQRDAALAADVERRKAEAAKAEAKRQQAQAALRVAYIEDARKAGFDAYDDQVEWSEPEAYAGDEEALKAHREGWNGCAEQAAKFQGRKRDGGSAEASP